MNARILLPVLVSCFPASLAAQPASPQASRTWVSGVGDDVNPCSRTAPCKTFAGALLKTSAGGEINCLDPGGYGVVSITRSITIDCAGTQGSILATGTNGIIINGSNIVVVLRNLSINGGGTGVAGVRVLDGASLQMSNVRISGFAAANGRGVSIEAAGRTNIYIGESVVSGNSAGLTVGTTGGPSVMLVDSTVTNNAAAGLSASGGSARIWVSNSTISGNGTGVQAVNGATIASYGDNRLDGNGTNGQFTGPAAPRR